MKQQQTNGKLGYNNDGLLSVPSFLYKGAYLVLVGESMLSLIFMWELKGTRQ